MRESMVVVNGEEEGMGIAVGAQGRTGRHFASYRPVTCRSFGIAPYVINQPSPVILTHRVLYDVLAFALPDRNGIVFNNSRILC